jgi:hypothetical protein
MGLNEKSSSLRWENNGFEVRTEKAIDVELRSEVRGKSIR